MVYIFLVDGYEDTEMIAPLDMLSRAGIPTTTVGVMGKTVTSKLGLSIQADITADEVDLSDCEMIFLPGGPGTKNYFDKPIIDEAIAYCVDNGKYLSAICAAPSVLSAKGVLKDKKAVCHFSVNDKMECRELLTDLVCVDGKVITGRGAAASVDFGLALVEALRGKEAADKVKHGICYAE